MSAEAEGRVLVVDDDALVRALVRRTLESASWRVSEAADGAEAIRMLEPLPLTIEAVLTDIMMPGVRGDELLDVLASNRLGLALVAITANLEHPVPRSVPVLTKPFSPRLLATTLDGAITRARRIRADALQMAADSNESRSIARAQRARAAQMRANVDLMKEVLARRKRLAAGGAAAGVRSGCFPPAGDKPRRQGSEIVRRM